MAEKRKTSSAGKKALQKGQVNIYGVDGKVKDSIKLPGVFDTPYRPDLIRRAVVSAQANRRQRYGPSLNAGMRHSVSTWGKGRGVARVQRLTQGRTAAQSPNNVGGRRAHPPRPEHSFEKKINIKEKRFAKASALAAASVEERVRARGHRFKAGITLPVVVDDDIEKLDRARDVLAAIRALGLEEDIRRAHDGRHIRAGRGKMRGRRFRQPRSILFVATRGSSLLRAARNLPGVHTTDPEGINTELLAPGGDSGRLIVISRSALESIGGEK
ncbi:MAG TPA: 50S ribosomal protein L4 [Euryarchaeota archaeon]|nr:MAG: 50S ribosomal protein L4 [Thermoplasmata archaeon]HHD16129.1 50S ribosomal protein L4 [Euryarchaeota archaeon]